MNTMILLFVFIFSVCFHKNVLAFDYNKDPIFELKNKKYFASDLPDNIKQRLFDIQMEQYNMIKFTIEQYLLNKFFEDEAIKNKTTVEKIKQKYLSIKPPTEKELKEFYDKNRSKISEYAYEDIKEQIKQIIEEEKRNQAKENLLNKIKKDLSFNFLVPQPTKPVMEFNLDIFPYLGSVNPKVTIVEFGDYLCPHCKEASNILNKIISKYKDQIKFIFIHFYLYKGSYSIELAKGAYCAKEQGKFWEYHNLVYSDKKETLGYFNIVMNLATELNLDMLKFKECLNSSKAHDFVEEGRLLGDKKGINATPTFFINGEKYIGEYSEKALEEQIKKALSTQ